MFDEKEPKTRKTKPKLQSKARNTGPGHVHRNAGHDAGIAGHVHRNTQCSLMAALVERNGTHANTDRHRSMVVESNA